ncbi:hypothetical protein FRC01_009538, partial [Tulasnella sp. 417]
LITALVARWRNNPPAGAAVSANRPSTVYTFFRHHWLIVAVLGRPVSTSTPDVEQANTAPLVPIIDPSASTPSLPAPAYMQRHFDSVYIGDVAYMQPWIHNAPGPGLITVPAPPAYSSSSSLPRTAPGTSTPSS